jgi:uncharacterized protein (DUF3084 family)
MLASLLAGATVLVAILGVALTTSQSLRLDLFRTDPIKPEAQPAPKRLNPPAEVPGSTNTQPQEGQDSLQTTPQNTTVQKPLNTAGFVLILAVLLLGGGIATLGDRLGSKVGKARLSLFKLRPRQTATVVTILSGIVVSATTLGVLFAASESLRDGVFKLDQIQKKRRDIEKALSQANTQLSSVRGQKTQVERELTQSKTELGKTQNQLNTTQRSLKSSLAKLSEAQKKQAATETQLNTTQQRLAQTTTNFEQAKIALTHVSQQAQNLRSDITQLKSEQKDLARQRDQLKTQNRASKQKIAELDQTIAQRDRDLANREKQLATLEQQRQLLEKQRVALETQVTKLKADADRLLEALRLGNVALRRNDILYKGIVEGLNAKSAPQAVDAILQAANREARQRLLPGTKSEQIIQITIDQVKQLVEQIDDGRPYVIRILSAGNYLVGETRLRVFADIALNQLVFKPGEQFAVASAVDPSILTENELSNRLNSLFAASQFRAERNGVLADSVELDIGDITQFVEKLKQQTQPLDIRALAAEAIYTAGPLRIELVAVRNGQVLFRSNANVQ